MDENNRNFTREELVERLKSVQNKDIVKNAYSVISGDHIYDNDPYTLQELFSGDVAEAIRKVCYGDYRYSDDFFVYDGYGNLESFNDVDKAIDYGLLADSEYFDKLSDIDNLEDFLRDIS